MLADILTKPPGVLRPTEECPMPFATTCPHCWTSWHTIEQMLDEHAELAPDAWIEKMRDQQGMRNDDVTLIVVHT